KSRASCQRRDEEIRHPGLSSAQSAAAPADLALVAGPRGWRQAPGRKIPRTAEQFLCVEADPGCHPVFLRHLAQFTWLSRDARLGRSAREIRLLGTGNDR